MENIKQIKEVEFNKAKNEMILAIANFYKTLEKHDISFIDNYPEYLPSFNEFMYEIMDIEYSKDND